MSLFAILIVFIIVCIICAAIYKFAPFSEPIKWLIGAAIVIIFLLWILQGSGHLGNIRL